MGRRSVLLVAVAAGVLLAGAGAPVAMPRPGPIVRARSAATTNAECERCHADIAAEWRQSLHHASFTDRDVQRVLARETERFCHDCHAPESEVLLGVACVTCHLTNADVLAAPGTTTTTAPHALTRTADFAGVPACARCHTFDFPDGHLRRTPLAMQRTVTEHAGRSDTCQSCHMRRREGHADHRFSASRDPAVVRGAVAVEATRVSERLVRVVLTPRDIGHAFPTGDLFRRVRVTAGGATRYLARHYENRQERPGIVVRAEVSDDRVQGGPRVVELAVEPGPVRVEVVYERAEGPSGVRSSKATVAGAIPLLDVSL